MGFKLKVGKDDASLDERIITGVEFSANTPDNSNARSTNLGLGVKVWGKMIYSLGAKDKDQVFNLAVWAGMRAENPLTYRAVDVQVVSSGQTVRKYELPNAFIVEYTEDLDEETGVGIFYIHLRQKKDQNKAFKATGGFKLSDK